MLLLRMPSLVLLGARAFQTSAPLAKEWRLIEKSRKVAKRPEVQVGDKRGSTYIPKTKIAVPDYKWGDRTLFKKSNRGLLGGKFIQFGNQVSEMKNKTSRQWLPNIQKKSLWSESLQKSLPLQVTTSVLRIVTKEGGLDNYLTKDKAARIKELGPLGWKLRYQVLQSQTRQQKPTVEVKGVVYTVYHTYKGHAIRYNKKTLISKLCGMVYNPQWNRMDVGQFKKALQAETIDGVCQKMEKHRFDFSTVSVPSEAQTVEAAKPSPVA